jgi:hypothetical protein
MDAKFVKCKFEVNINLIYLIAVHMVLFVAIVFFQSPCTVYEHN